METLPDGNIQMENRSSQSIRKDLSELNITVRKKTEESGEKPTSFNPSVISKPIVEDLPFDGETGEDLGHSVHQIDSRTQGQK